MTGGPITENDLQALVDGRLSAERAAEIEAWLAGRPQEAQRIAALRQDRDLLQAALAPIASEPLPAHIAALFARRPVAAWRRAAAALIIFAVGGAVGWAGGQWIGRAPPGQVDVVRAAIGAHRVFVPEVRHPVEVPAGEQVHLVTWLSKRLGHKLAAPDLTASGFRLVGGRLLSQEGRPAALFMYENAAGQRITIHCVPEPRGATTAFRFREIDGVSAFYWIDEKLAYAVIGSVGQAKLQELARAVYTAYENR